MDVSSYAEFLSLMEAEAPKFEQVEESDEDLDPYTDIFREHHPDITWALWDHDDVYFYLIEALRLDNNWKQCGLGYQGYCLDHQQDIRQCEIDFNTNAHDGGYMSEDEPPEEVPGDEDDQYFEPNFSIFG